MTSRVRAVALLTVVAAFALLAALAWGDAADPVLSSTTGNVVTNGDGSHTVTVQGQWQWTTHHSDCNTNRSGVGYAVDWHDPTAPGNHVTTLNGVSIDVGTPSDNVVHPTPGPVFQDIGNPSQWQSWRSGCGAFNGSYNTGSWGPISHTYPASVSGPFSICALMYDVHGKSSGTAPNGEKEVTAGGDGHNGDNSAQTNKDTPLGNGCFTATFQAPPPQVQVLGQSVQSGSARLSGPTGCVARAFRVRVSGRSISHVVFKLDGRVIKRLSSPNSSGGVYSVRIDPSKLRFSVHRVTADVTFNSSSRTAPRRLRLSFQRCARRQVTPRFTG
jgi:hypothetical protein